MLLYKQYIIYYFQLLCKWIWIHTIVTKNYHKVYLANFKTSKSEVSFCEFSNWKTHEIQVDIKLCIDFNIHLKLNLLFRQSTRNWHYLYEKCTKFLKHLPLSGSSQLKMKVNARIIDLGVIWSLNEVTPYWWTLQ